MTEDPISRAVLFCRRDVWNLEGAEPNDGPEDVGVTLDGAQIPGEMFDC